MNAHGQTPKAGMSDPVETGVIKLAVLAVGGQGGGVLTNWIESLARAQGYVAQATSVAGVSQRTGATIYYIEMAPNVSSSIPVFSLAPAAGDIDILIAAELMEAGRAITRGFVTPDRTTLIASSHRALAVSEKMVPGNGISDPAEVLAATDIAARRVILADMDQLAVANGSVISATLFGALAGAQVLPFERAAFEDAIRQGGKGVDASLAAFDAGYAVTQEGSETPDPAKVAQDAAEVVTGAASQRDALDRLMDDVADLPAEIREIARLGLQKTVEFQDVDYGREYLDRLRRVIALDAPERGFDLSREAAKYIANAMVYDDIIRVADLKTRRDRFDNIRREMGAVAAQVIHVTEFMHPRAQEIVGMLPPAIGSRIADSERWMNRIDRWFGKGRRYRSSGLVSFLVLYSIGGLRIWRRRTLRHKQEQSHLDEWLAAACRIGPEDYALAVEVLRCRRLIKGYSDTHARGLTKFDKVLAAAERLRGRHDAADWVARLREAALQDEQGKALDGALKTVESFL